MAMTEQSARRVGFMPLQQSERVSLCHIGKHSCTWRMVYLP